MGMPIDANALFMRLDPELWLVTAAANSQRSGLIATCVTVASIVPELPRVVVGLGKRTFTWELVETSEAFTLHLLGDSNVEWVDRFGLRSGRDGDKFDGLTVATTPNGSPLLTDALGWLDCRVESRMDAGDRVIYLAAVTEGRAVSDRDPSLLPPLTMKRFIQRTDSLDELARQRRRDAQLDAEAIRNWRDQNAQ